MKTGLPQLRVAAVLGVAATIATALLFPYLLQIMPAAAATPLPRVVLGALQSGLLCFVLGWAGLKLGAPLGLGAPWLAARLYGRARPTTSNWRGAALLGALSGAAILAAVALFGAPIDAANAPKASAWAGLLASYYGGVVEEILLRVFAMGSLAWLLARASGGAARPWLMLVAIVIAALAFGIGHLPAAAQLGPLTAAIVSRVIAYNALAGLVFGALYWKRGLEHAMLAHFCTDLVLHVAAPLLSA